MYLCVGTFLTTLKICKASTTKQKRLGESVFHAIKPGFDCGDDDSAISAVFRGKRNLHSYLQLEFEDINPNVLSLRFSKEVVPLLDENKREYIVTLLLALIGEDSIDENTHVELVNNIKKKDLLIMKEFVFEEFLAGIFLYTIRFTENLNKEAEVKAYKSYAENELTKEQCKFSFISQYMAGPFVEDDSSRPVISVYNQGGTIIDVLYTDILEVGTSYANIVIPVNTSFDTEIEAKLGSDIIPLVSENTIHGQWITSIKKKGIRTIEIDDQIKKSLRMSKISKCKVRNTAVGKQDVYPIASIASVLIEDKKYYLLALSEFDELNKAQSEVSYIKKSINAVVDFYDLYGQGYDIYIPLLGTGRSRARLSLQESYELIREILLLRKSDIFGRVHIVIHPSQVEQVMLEV